jgi:superfamily II DNA/RNA helicase
MLDLGFTKEVTSILKQLPAQKLVLLFSATVDNSIKRIISRYIPDSKTIEVGEMKIVSSIKEEKIEVPHREKSSKLLELLESHKNMKTLIFLRTKRSVINLKYQLTKLGIERVGMLQGDMPQAKRIRVLNRFKENDLSVLVATNVAARGLHIDDVGLIINYDRAENKETHLHRVGRTGRMGQNGKVINFISNDGPSFGRGGNRRSGRNSERRSDRNRGGRSGHSGNRNKRPNGRTGRPGNRNRSQGKRNAGPGDKNPRRLPENNSDSRHSGARSHSPRRGKKSGGQSKRGSRPGDKSPRRSRKPARFRFSKSRRNR